MQLKFFTSRKNGVSEISLALNHTFQSFGHIGATTGPVLVLCVRLLLLRRRWSAAFLGNRVQTGALLPLFLALFGLEDFVLCGALLGFVFVLNT